MDLMMLKIDIKQPRQDINLGELKDLVIPLIFQSLNEHHRSEHCRGDAQINPQPGLNSHPMRN